MIVENPPLAQWQIDHLRRMQEQLGSPQSAPDVEEVTMDKKLGALNTVTDVDADVAAADAVAGGLAVPNVQSAMTAYNKLAAEQQSRYDAQAKALAEKRYGPSFSERMFQLSAALAQPTSRRGFGGILENITPVLAAQQKAQREGEISRKDALELLQSNRLAQQVGLAKQGLTTSLAMERIKAAEKKSQEPKLVFAEGAWRLQPGTGGYPTMPNMDQFGNYIITDRRQIEYLPPNTPVVEVGQDPMKPKYVPNRSNPDR